MILTTDISNNMSYPLTGMPKQEVNKIVASGPAFPVWNTMDGDNKLLSLSIHGRTEQSAVPTPQSPISLQSVGDDGLLLSVMSDKTGGAYQLLNIGAAMVNIGHDGVLRSVNGVYDEIIYSNGKWKLIQKIGVSKGYIVNNVLLDAENGSLAQYQVLGNPKGGNASTAYPAFLSNKFYYTGDATSNKWRNLYGVWTNSLRYRFYCIADKSSHPDTVSFRTLASDVTTVYYYVLNTPVEYTLDLPVISTYEGQTYFATNPAGVKPRMVAECQVRQKLDYIKDGLIGYWSGRGRSNTDADKSVLPDLSGNGNDLTNYNMAYTPTSGYGDGYLQYDGIDDLSKALNINLPTPPVTVLLTVSNIQKLGSTSNAWSGLLSGSNYYLGISKGTGFTQSGAYILDGAISANFNILEDTNIHQAGVYNNVYKGSITGINIGTILNSASNCAKQKFYDALCYNRVLSSGEITHTYKVSQQFNGDNFDGYTI